MHHAIPRALSTPFGTPLLGLCLLLALPGCASVDALINIEEPAYKVLRQDGNFEVREYQSMVIAETVVSGTLDEATDRGFRAIADYIFGGNLTKVATLDGATKSNEKIAMTVPVTMARDGEKIAMTAPVTMEPSNNAGVTRWRMHFVMPSRYTLATLPTPKNPNVTLREVPPQRVAAHRFSGFSGETKVAEKTAALNIWMREANLKATGVPQLARYNPPITPPPFRRNEVLIPIE